MTQRTITVIIPARMASSRYPGKPLAMILGLPMIEHVRRRVCLCPDIARAVVATCDQEIFDVVARNGGTAVMTSPKHERSSGRVAEAMRSLPGGVVVVVQGDEPLLLPEAVTQVAAPLLTDGGPDCASLLSPLEGEADYANPNIVKAACDQRGQVLFFSRAPIPYRQRPGPSLVYRETGFRAFRADFLQTYDALPETPFERVESVDMLRVLEHGYRIQGVVTDYVTFGVDHAHEVPRVEQVLRTDPVQRALDGRIRAGRP